MMINAMNAIMRKPEFIEVVRPPTSKEIKHIPRDYNIKKIYHVISQSVEVGVQKIINNTMLSGFCVRKALLYMESKGMIISKVIGKAGPCDICTYRAIKPPVKEVN